MAENVVTRYDPHFHLGMRVMTLIWCFTGWQVWLKVKCKLLQKCITNLSRLCAILMILFFKEVFN